MRFDATHDEVTSTNAAQADRRGQPPVLLSPVPRGMASGHHGSHGSPIGRQRLSPLAAGPDVPPADAKGESLLQSLVSLTQGVTEIRNQVGVDHGAEEVPSWISPRHARLVVGAAQVWCQLMVETLGDQSAPWRSRPVVMVE